MQFSIVEMWHEMGTVVKFIAYILILMSIITVAVGIERFIAFFKAKAQSKELLRLIAALWKEGKVRDSLELTRDKRFKSSHLAKVLSAGLFELEFQEDSSADYSQKIESAKRAIDRATIKGIHEFKRGLNSVGTVGATAPFVGLTGTVFGIINAFQGMAVSGSGGIGAVAAGIAEALIMTGMGIALAVVAVWFFNYLIAKVDVFTGEMANASSELIDQYIKLNK